MARLWATEAADPQRTSAALLRRVPELTVLNLPQYAGSTFRRRRAALWERAKRSAFHLFGIKFKSAFYGETAIKTDTNRLVLKNAINFGGSSPLEELRCESYQLQR